MKRQGNPVGVELAAAVTERLKRKVIATEPKAELSATNPTLTTALGCIRGAHVVLGASCSPQAKRG
ncbi:hypothetical protein MUP00_08665 [Candidatus Bathyarchaeota archaeon]|nr:hypothetical protein [Candidatus Bathyarchaeota archaeon]